jgi:hypothetical protein
MLMKPTLLSLAFAGAALVFGTPNARAEVSIQELTLLHEKTAVVPAENGAMQLGQVFRSAGVAAEDREVLEDDSDNPGGSYPAQYSSSSYPDQYSSSSYPDQYSSSSYPDQYSSSSYPSQYSSSSYPSQYSSSSYPAQYTGSMETQDVNARLQEARYRGLPVPQLAN